MKLLGMQIYPRRKSDTEYIAAVRKSIHRSKWIALINACMFAVFVVCFFMFWRLILSVQATFPEYAEAIGQGAHIGIMLGAFAGFLLFLGVVNLVFAILSFAGQRTARLMLKFYDELENKGMRVHSADTGEPN